MIQMRTVLPLIALLLWCLPLAACSDSGPAPAAPQAETTKDKEVVSPVTGLPQIQAQHDTHRDAIEELERAAKAGTPAEARLVRQHLRGIDILIVAAEKSIGADTRHQVRMAHARLIQQHTLLYNKRDLINREIREIEEILQAHNKGVGEIPPGFTAAELADNLGDAREKARAVEKQIEEVKKEMKDKEDLLAEKEIPPQAETLASRELTALQALRKRAEALLR